MKDRLMSWLDEYYEEFGDQFPTMCFQTESEDEMIRLIRDCIESNNTAEELYQLDYVHNVY